MAIDYFLEAEKYRPTFITTLLIGEAPPPSGKFYFYVPRTMSTNRSIETDTSLPATIFNHYFETRPQSVEDYTTFLSALRENGIFLIDICDEPIRVRGSDEGLKRIIEDIPKLRAKIESKGIVIQDESITFLLARNNYKSHIRREFPTAKYFSWKKFRTEPKAIFKSQPNPP